MEESILRIGANVVKMMIKQAITLQVSPLEEPVKN